MTLGEDRDSVWEGEEAAAAACRTAPADRQDPAAPTRSRTSLPSPQGDVVAPHLWFRVKHLFHVLIELL